MFGERGFQAKQALNQLYSFGARAYRRPLTAADRAGIRKTYDRRIGEKATPRQAALDTLKMMLCSPSFLYLSEITAEKDPKLGPSDLAAHLSYALWSAPPDSALLAAAAAKKLTAPNELRQQASRLLADDRVGGMVNGFLDSWLNLRDLGRQPPARESTRVYYAENLPEVMKTEVRLFFHLLRENGSVRQLLDADYTFADKRLARLYNLPEQKTLRIADGFQRVSLTGSRERGGLLGMAGVLTVSANGVETSPVTRGVWVSENILGIKPPPPPDVVPAIEPDVSGATTIRERLAKHRADPTCNEGHRKIDPLGFGLETFDPVGRWRETYPKTQVQGARPESRFHRRVRLGGNLRRLPRFQGHPRREPDGYFHPPPHQTGPQLRHGPTHGTERRIRDRGHPSGREAGRLRSAHPHRRVPRQRDLPLALRPAAFRRRRAVVR